MGGAPWPCGFARSREEIAAVVRLALADGLAEQATAPEALLDPSTLDLAERG